jgi:hypothetical protein
MYIVRGAIPISDCNTILQAFKRGPKKKLQRISTANVSEHFRRLITTTVLRPLGTEIGETIRIQTGHTISQRQEVEPIGWHHDEVKFIGDRYKCCVYLQPNPTPTIFNVARGSSRKYRELNRRRLGLTRRVFEFEDVQQGDVVVFDMNIEHRGALPDPLLQRHVKRLLGLRLR